MDSIAPPQAVSTPKPATAAPKAPEQAKAAEAAQQRTAHVAEVRKDLTPDALSVQLDKNAGRFVQTITDPDTSDVVLRYPSESQLAYSRAVMAYLRTLSAR
jgi:hypothetical protein